MISRLIFLCACLQVLSIVASSGNVVLDNSNNNSESLSIVKENAGSSNQIRRRLDGSNNPIEKEIEGKKDVKTGYDNPGNEIIHNVDGTRKVTTHLDKSNDAIDTAIERTKTTRTIQKKIEESKVSTNLFDEGKSQSKVSESPWFTSIPLLPLVYARSSTLPDGPCKKQAQRYLRDLENGTLWATQMYDASAKYPDGLISGHTVHLGDFDGCYNLEVKLVHRDDDDFAIDEEINGRYCLVDIQYEKQGLPPIDPKAPLELAFDPNDSVWEAIRERGDTRRARRYKLEMALCVPEVCSHTDIEAALQEPLQNFGAQQNLNINISVKPQFCQARKDAPAFSRAAKIYCSIVGGLIVLVVISTWYDFKSEDDEEQMCSTARGLMLCFSARRNFNALLEPTTSYRGLQTIPLTRTVWMGLSMIGHRMVQYWVGPLVNVNYIESLYSLRTSMIVFGGTNLIEGFYGLSGLLVSYGLLAELDVKKRVNFLGLILIRFLRLTPLYMFVVFFCAFILPYTGSGPFWEWKIGSERDACANYWWTNLFYINNYVHADKMCLFQSWYLSSDYHLFTLALIVTYIFWRIPRKYGYLFLSTIILAGCLQPFINTYVYGVQPMYIGYLSLREVRDDPYFLNHYIKTHERITSYFIGVLVGAIIYDHSRAPWYLGKVSSHISFILLVVCFSLGSQLFGHQYLDPNAKPTPLEAALYASLHKGAFAIATCSLSLITTVGTGLTFHWNFLTPRWCQPLSRITYGAYLVHTIIQLYYVGVTRSSRTYTVHSVVYFWLGDVFCAFGLSFILAILIEGPFRRLEKCFITKRKLIDQSNGMTKGAKKEN